MIKNPLDNKKEKLEKKIRAREFVFGIQDGLISTVGLLSGVAVATNDAQVVAITGIAAAITGGLSMATGSYLSSLTEKEVFEKELLDQEQLAADQPYLAQEALLETMLKDGLDRQAAYKVVKTFSKRERLLLETVQEKVLGIGTADISQPIKAAITMFLSFLLGAAFPVVPFLLKLGSLALPISWIASITALLSVGVFKGYLTGKPLVRSGLSFAGIALGAAAAGWIIGKLVEM